MTKNLLYAAFGIIAGFAIGFLITNNLMVQPVAVAPNQTLSATTSSAPPLNSSQVGAPLPSNHPSLNAADNSSAANQTSTVPTSPQDRENAGRAADAAPTDFDKQMLAAIALYEAEDFAKAAAYLEQAIKINPTNADALTALADTRYHAGDVKGAQEMYGRALAANPDLIDVRANLGNTFYLSNDFARAISEYELALQRDARHEKTLQNLALAQIKIGNLAAARTTIERLTAINPNNAALNSLRSQAS